MNAPSRLKFVQLASVVLLFALLGSAKAFAQDAPAVPPPPPPPPPPAPLVTAQPISFDDGIHRQGFTLQLSIGGGSTTFLREKGKGDNQTYGAVSGDLQLGGFLTPGFAITGKVSSMNWGSFRTDELDSAITGFVGPNAQFWFGDHFSFEAGVGFGVSTVAPKSIRVAGVRISPDEDTQTGLGLALAANYFFWASEHHALGIQAQFQPSFLKDGPIMNGHLAFVWQYY